MTPSQVILTTANAFDVDPGLVCSHLRAPDVLSSRHVAAYLLVTRLNLSSTQVANELGGQHRTTILNALRQVRKRQQEDHVFNSLITSLDAQLDLMQRMEGLSVYNVLAIANNASNSRHAAMALSVHEIMAISNSLLEVWEIAEAAGVLAHHIKTAANPKAIFEIARTITDSLSLITEIKPTQEENEDE